MTEHTKGPWSRNIKSKDARYPVIFAGRNTHVAIAKGHGELPPEEIEANISLIASAPELLAACKFALIEYRNIKDKLDIINGNGSGNDDAITNELNYVINQAMGE